MVSKNRFHPNKRFKLMKKKVIMKYKLNTIKKTKIKIMIDVEIKLKQMME